MKLNKFIYLACTALILGAATSSCKEEAEVYEPSITTVEKPDMVIDAEAIRAKIGTPQLIPVTAGAGDYKAYSLDPAVCEVINNPDGSFIDGKKNGMTSIIVSDAAGNYKRVPVSVYTTDVMSLETTAVDLVATLGYSATTTAKVAVGNGGYTVLSDNLAVTATIDEETGAMNISATSKMQEYTATLTVKDITGLEAKFTVTVKATFDPFVQSELDNLINYTGKGDCSLDGYQPYYFRYFNSYNYGTFESTDTDGTTKFGWAYRTYSSMFIYYPSTAQVGEEVTGRAAFEGAYDGYSAGGKQSYTDGKVKILLDDATKKVVIFWKIDEAAEKLHRGYIIWMKPQA